MRWIGTNNGLRPIYATGAERHSEAGKASREEVEICSVCFLFVGPEQILFPNMLPNLTTCDLFGVFLDCSLPSSPSLMLNCVFVDSCFYFFKLVELLGSFWGTVLESLGTFRELLRNCFGTRLTFFRNL